MHKLAVCLCTLTSLAILARADSPAMIHYQGRLVTGTNLYSGPVNIVFRMYDAPSGGTLLYFSTNAATAVDGLYATVIGQYGVGGNLDYVLTSTQVWLEVQINGVTVYPRERILAVPYARAVHGLRVVDDNNIVLNSESGLHKLLDSRFSVISGGNDHLVSNAWYATIGGGGRNQIQTYADFAAISGGRENRISDYAQNAVIGGGMLNEIRATATNSTIAGGHNNIIFPGTKAATIGGGGNNSIGSGFGYATIAGGLQNNADEDFVAIGGGRQNTVFYDSTNAVIAGGYLNTIRDSCSSATIGGGGYNEIQSGSFGASISGGEGAQIKENSPYAAICGGASGMIGYLSEFAVIGGGVLNWIGDNAPFSIIAGGQDNRVSNNAHRVWIAGRRATARHPGVFMWADSHDLELHSTTSNQATFRVSGGFRIFSNAGMTLGVQLAPNASAWAAISDRDAKENIEPIDTGRVLEGVRQMPLSSWNYIADPEERRYIGPMAQDFHAQFGLGDDKTINTLDADGVLFAAVQALAAENERLREELAKKDREFRLRLEAIEEKLGRIQ